MGEFKLESTEKAEMVLKLIEDVEESGDHEYPLSYYIDAAKDYSCIDEARRCLIKPCPICAEDYPVHEVSVLLPGQNTARPSTSYTCVILVYKLSKSFPYIFNETFSHQV